MAKYDPVRSYLQRQRSDVIELSFRESENLIGYLLPKAAAADSSWSAATDRVRTGVQHAALATAGFALRKWRMNGSRFDGPRQPTGRGGPAPPKARGRGRVRLSRAHPRRRPLP